MTDIIAPAVVAGEHLQKRTLTILRYIPDHPDRTGTPLFDRTRHELITNNPNARCEIHNHHCDGDHPLELHHNHLEWCDSEGANWERLREEVTDFPWKDYDHDLVKNEAGVWILQNPVVFVDSRWNANRVLCKRHHTGNDHGIHMLDYPTWQAQKYLRPEIVFSPDEVPPIAP